MFISVIGDSTPTDEVYKIAEEVGQEVALAGATLICGGLSGVMEAAAKGAKSVGGTTVGIIPTNRRQDANPYIDIPIITGIGYARNVIVVLSGQVIIAISGKYGTLCEIAYALDAGLPVIGLGTWVLCKDGVGDNRIIVVKGPKEAVRKAVEIIQGIKK